MKRLLLVAHAFPPAPSPGALRPGYLARYLPQHGWEVTVLTNTAQAPPFPARVIRAGTSAATFEERLRGRLQHQGENTRTPLRPLLRAIKGSLLFPDATAAWIPEAIVSGLRILKSQHFDAILSTAHPPSVHVIAWALSMRSGVPWVADFRDPWAGNAYVKQGFVRRSLERLAERALLRRAAAVTTISEPIATQLSRFHNRHDVAVIPNAYDLSDWDAVGDLQPAQFDLCYAGSMYDGKRSPDLLFAALNELRASANEAGTNSRVHFYGPNSDNVMTSATRYGLNSIVRQHGIVPRIAAMRAQRRAAMLLIFLNMDPATCNEMGSKFLEYLGARRPILAIGPRDSIMRKFIQENGLGWFASDLTETKEALCSAFARFKSGDRTRAHDPGGVPTAELLARHFHEVLQEVSGDEGACGVRRRIMA